MKWGADCQKIEFTASAKPGDIVAQIDKLVSEEKCPHCGRDRHTRAITRDLLAMYERGRTDPSYFVKKDTSPILCDGSTFIGPLRPAPPAHQVFQGVLDAIEMLTGVVASVPPPIKFNLWLPGDPLWTDEASALAAPDHQPVCSDLVVEFGPHNWHLDFQYVPQNQQIPPLLTPWFHATPKGQLTYKIGDLWDEVTAVPAPTPKPYDWSQIQTNLTPQGFSQHPTMKGHKNEGI